METDLQKMAENLKRSVEGDTKYVDMLTGKILTKEGKPHPEGDVVAGIDKLVDDADMPISEDAFMSVNEAHAEAKAGNIRVGAYTENGETYVFVDSTKREALSSGSVNKLAYDFRFRAGVPNAGIDTSVGPYKLGEDEQPASLFGKGVNTWRVVVKMLTSPT